MKQENGELKWSGFRTKRQLDDGDSRDQMTRKEMMTIMANKETIQLLQIKVIKWQFKKFMIQEMNYNLWLDIKVMYFRIL